MEESEANELDAEDLVGRFTLEDTHDHLKEIEKELHEEMDDLINIYTNNHIETISSNSTCENIQLKQDKMVLGLLDNSCDYDPRIRPIPNTVDSYKLTIWELEQEVSRIEDIIESLSNRLANVKNNITYLETEISGLDRMKEVCSDTTENVANTAYDKEIIASKKLFSSVKNDLASVVELVLPEHLDFKDLLVDLTKAHTKGGNDIYINVEPNYLDCIEFLVEAEIIMQHRNDKNKIRLMDLV